MIHEEVKNMNRKIVISAISILSSLTLMAGATFAAFTSSSSNTGNTFGSGTLTLTVTPQGGTTSTPAFTVTNIAPGDFQTKSITLANTGTVNATLTKLVSVGHSTSSSPDLGDKLTLQIYDDVNGNGAIDGGDVLKGTGHVNDGSLTNIDLGFGITAGGSHKIVAKVTFDSDATDTYQGKNSSFDLNFQTSQ